MRPIPFKRGAALAVLWLGAGTYAALAQSPGDPPAAIPSEMVLIPGGAFYMGSAGGHDDEKPVHEVTLGAFLLDRHEVTTRQFADFVEATGYETEAERAGGAWCYLEGESDFRFVEGATWEHPDGRGSGSADRLDRPVVCVTWNDAEAYARWAGKRLPTEAEWEYAARSRGGRHINAGPDKAPSSSPTATEAWEHHRHDHVEGPASGPVAEHPSSRSHAHDDPLAQAAEGDLLVLANTWQGTWPAENKLADGYFGTSPVAAFRPNGLGLHDMLGNVWEWTADWYDRDYYRGSPRENPKGPHKGVTRVARGGSWFCSPNYCAAYNSHYRGASPPDHAFNNVGFRCAADWDREAPATRPSHGSAR